MKDRERHPESNLTPHGGSTIDMSEGNTRAVVEFTATKASILEREGHVKIGLRRYGKVNSRVLVRSVILVKDTELN